ncbi:sn-glycerol-3-phosphate import ATP-binding protein UgpC [Catellatospora sp. IY07-71]|uniref:ABC transporter ATP-binding protein n=1 Tax=Catellatospora sp. IY07-71 TaxID=2728827 RepID=UPI001BB3E7E6|nr:sn-glycerol-3-phosphate import ATP-binding protein UgpC [Catellatospora sp. IY07-71]
MTAGLSLRGVHLTRGAIPALRGIDLTVARGELLVVLGPSGAGKSSLLRAVAGLDRVTDGTVAIAGRDVTALRPGQRDVSMVFQSYSLLPHLTVADNIAFGHRIRGADRRTAADRAAAAAASVGCADLLTRRPHQLSGGERQRVALARALVREPDVFLLDEPLAHLDAALRTSMRTEIRAVHDRLGATTIYVTHDQSEAMALGDRIAVLHDGRIEQLGTPDEVWHRPRTRFVASFVGAPGMNLLPGDGPLRPPGTAADVELGVRPEHVALSAAHSTPARTLGEVARVEVLGEDALIHLRLGGHAVVAKVPARTRPAPGDRVTVHVADEHLHAFDAATGERIPLPAEAAPR